MYNSRVYSYSYREYLRRDYARSKACVWEIIISACREACNENCFAVLDSAGTAYKRKIKEALHIMWEGPNLNKQLNHYNISLNFWLWFVLLFFTLIPFFDLYIPIRLIDCTVY